jgi:nucleoside 2-deoxyribosyltransferase
VSRPRVFLAAPYSQWMDPETGEVAVRHRARLERLRTRFIDSGARVFSAHHNELWGRGWLPAEQCTPADFHAMRAAQVVCAVVGDPPSSGVAVELGWASAFGKPIVVLTTETAACSPLILGIGSITTARQVVVSDLWTDDVVASVADLTLSLAAPVDVDRPMADGYVDHESLGYVGVGFHG